MVERNVGGDYANCVCEFFSRQVIANIKTMRIFLFFRPFNALYRGDCSFQMIESIF
jgi:hypothetical protein